MLDRNICIEEKEKMIDYYTCQLTNSGYNYDQQRDIIESALKGIIRKDEKRQQ